MNTSNTGLREGAAHKNYTIALFSSLYVPRIIISQGFLLLWPLTRRYGLFGILGKPEKVIPTYYIFLKICMPNFINA